MNYYNEFDPKAAAWLRELIKAELIPLGDVDERSIKDVRATDLLGYCQCHFFAGIGGWPYALALAGWPEDRPVWTGSCPCQPFSVGSVGSGGAKGQEDDRHLLPVFCSLIGECKPPVVFGEQVASAVRWGWFDELCGLLEARAYACAATIIPARAVGAVHQRDRLYWVANASSEGRQGRESVKRFLVGAGTSQPVARHPLTHARRALAGDFSDLLPCDGLSIQLERDALKGYGNAIVPQVAAEFIGAYLDTLDSEPATPSGIAPAAATREAATP